MTVTTAVSTLPAHEYSQNHARDEREPVVRLAHLDDHEQPYVILNADGVTAAIVTVEGSECLGFATDPAKQGGALGKQGCAAIATAYRIALRKRVPIIGIWQSGGARLNEGAASLDAVGTIFNAMTAASGVIPQISVVLGPAAGGAAYGPALTDVVIVSPSSRIFVTGPDVVNSVTGESVDALSLGGPEVHSKHSGLAHIETKSDDEAYGLARVTAILLQRRIDPSLEVRKRELAGLLPENTKRAYDIRPLINGVLDAPLLEIHRKWAPSMVVGLGRIDGRTVGVIANNPIRLGGCLTGPASEKAARFVRLCDSFGVPLVVLVDVPGYLPGAKQETDGIVRRGAKLLHAFAGARVPRFTVVTRKAFGGAFIAMNSSSLGATEVYAWPDAVIDVMASSAAVKITHRRDLATVAESDLDAAIDELAAQRDAETGGLRLALSEGLIDRVIDPNDTRDVLVQALRAYPAKPSGQKNIPL